MKMGISIKIGPFFGIQSHVINVHIKSLRPPRSLLPFAREWPEEFKISDVGLKSRRR